MLPAVADLSAVLALILAAPGGDGPAFQGVWSGWEQIANEDGMQVYRKESGDSPLILFGGETVLEAPAARVCSILLDVSRMVEWVDSAVETRTIRKTSPYDFVYYHAYDIPWPIANRDFVSLILVETDRAKSTMQLTEVSVEDAKGPEKDCCVRAELLESRIYVKPLGPNRTAVAAYGSVDMKGMIPYWLVNMIQRDFPQRTMQGYRDQVKKPDIRVLPECASIFGG